MILTRKDAKEQYSGLKANLPVTLPRGSSFFAIDTHEIFMYDDNLSPVLTGGNSGFNKVLVTQENVSETLGGVIDPLKEYFIDGIVDIGATQITVPVGGLTMKGYSFDISGLTTSVDGHKMFISEGGVGSGNLLALDLYFECTGTGAAIFDLTDSNGFHAIEMNRVNYNNCTSLGDIYNYRQGLELGTGRFGGSPSLTLHGTWVGGFRITTSITRNMSDTTTEPLFKAGTAFVMNSRFLTDMNVDLGTLQPLLDFAPANFTNPDTLQLQGMLLTRDGVTNASDANITPNITEKDLVSQWKDNLGVHNTFVGGESTVTTEVLTTITTIDTSYELLGTQTTSDLQHFDAPTNGKLRLLGDVPVAYTVIFDLIVDGTANNTLELELVKDDGGVETIVQSQKRVINNLSGGRDVAYFNGVFNLSLHKTDFVYWKIVNRSGTGNVTLELDSTWHVVKR
tara:strand:- start:1126 stop:2484 length:1359 start_codon:yes stop_codon:yes gene_type:complete